MENLNNSFKITSSELDEILTHGISASPEETLEILDKKGGLNFFLNSLKTDKINGIEGSEINITARIKSFGDNFDLKTNEKGICAFILEALNDPFLIVLIICAIFQISIGVSPLAENPERDWIDSFGIILAIVLIVYVSSFTNYSKEQQFRNLSKVNKSNMIVTVLRNGNRYNINFDNLLVGDIILLNQGMVIPADGILIESDDIKIDESSLTGEGKMVRKFHYEKCKEISERNKNINSNTNSFNNNNKSLANDLGIYNLDEMDRFKRGHSTHQQINSDASNLNSNNSNNNLRGNTNTNYNNNKNNNNNMDSIINNKSETKLLKLCSPFVYSGTTVNSGFGVLLVLAVGANSTKGKLQKRPAGIPT